MRVIYTKTIQKRLRDLIEKVMKTGRQIDYILISNEEMKELIVLTDDHIDHGVRRFESDNPCLDIINVPHPKGVLYNRYPAVLTHTFLGYKIAEVPKEYAYE